MSNKDKEMSRKPLVFHCRNLPHFYNNQSLGRVELVHSPISESSRKLVPEKVYMVMLWLTRVVLLSMAQKRLMRICCRVMMRCDGQLFPIFVRYGVHLFS